VKKLKRRQSILDLPEPQAIEQFRKMADAYTKRATKTPETALKTLVAEGIYTKSGKLTKNYS
jgi:hypothetical protein